MDLCLEHADVAEIPSDLLIVKCPQGPPTPLLVKVAHALVERDLCRSEDFALATDDYLVVETEGAIAPAHVLFLGTRPVHRFTHAEMFRFARDSLKAADDAGLSPRRITTTIHGAGRGLDPNESLQHLVGGFLVGYAGGAVQRLERLTFVERELGRVNQMAARGLASGVLHRVPTREVPASDYLAAQEEGRPGEPVGTVIPIRRRSRS